MINLSKVKALLMVGALGLSLMGGDCGGNSRDLCLGLDESKCAAQKDAKCEWAVVKPAVKSDAMCTGVAHCPTSVPAGMGTFAEFCVLVGCSMDADKCTGTIMKKMVCNAPSEEDCSGDMGRAIGCKWQAAVDSPEESACRAAK